MKITLKMDNCTPLNSYIFDFSATSSMELDIELKQLTSVQSKKSYRDKLVLAIQEELFKVGWLITGKVTVDLIWYLSAIERQEMDSAVDLDNLTKPVLDSLTGPSGILVDDSQIIGLYTKWFSKDLSYQSHFLKIKIDFNNEGTLQKENLHFIQFFGALCFGINLDLSDRKSLLATKVIAHSRKNARRLYRTIRNDGVIGAEPLVLSEYEFHRTRLRRFNSSILNMPQLNERCIAAGLTWRHLRAFLTPASTNSST